VSVRAKLRIYRALNKVSEEGGGRADGADGADGADEANKSNKANKANKGEGL